MWCEISLVDCLYFDRLSTFHLTDLWTCSGWDALRGALTTWTLAESDQLLQLSQPHVEQPTSSEERVSLTCFLLDSTSGKSSPKVQANRGEDKFELICLCFRLPNLTPRSHRKQRTAARGYRKHTHTHTHTDTHGVNSIQWCKNSPVPTLVTMTNTWVTS